jgi:hypothetical protein
MITTSPACEPNATGSTNSQHDQQEDDQWYPSRAIVDNDVHSDDRRQRRNWERDRRDDGFAKQRVGKEMGGRALVADSKETWVCSYLSLSLLLGVGTYAVVGWWWADTVGALAMLPIILWQGWETLAEARGPADRKD